MRTGRPSSAGTQRDRILGLLIDAHGAWVPLPEILALGIAQYGARILELRRSGHSIENRHETIDGARHSWFRLASGPSQAHVKPQEPIESDYMRLIRKERDDAAPLFAGVRP